MPKREKAGGETTFQNPLDGEDAATNFDDERDAPASGIDVQKATFDDDEAPSGAPQGDGTQSMSPRTQARVNAHYVQKFVGDNRKRQNAAHRLPPRHLLLTAHAGCSVRRGNAGRSGR